MENAFEFTTSSTGLKMITAETLAKIAPEAYAAAQVDLDFDESTPIWVMTAKPEMINPANDENYRREEWSETNEPELAEWIAEVWDQAAVNVGGQQVVILCGTEDDEYGSFWDASQGTWNDYMF